jgi:cyanobactin cluster PatC/TenC/TruC protein
MTASTTRDGDGQLTVGLRLKTDSEAARHAIQVAESAATSSAPVPVASVHPLATGLVDYGMWVEMFSRATPVEASQPYRRGRIWA